MKFKEISVIQLNKIKESVEKKYNIEVPSYEIKLAGGGLEKHPYDAKSILDDGTTDEDKKAWKQYQEQLKLQQVELNEKLTAYMFYEGIDCEVSEEWKAKQEWLGFDLPENQFDLKVQYVSTELLKTPLQIKDATAKIMQISMKGVDESAIKAAEATFPSTLSEE